jgi:hypothetical protein
VAAFEPHVLDVDANGFGDAQPVEGLQADQRVIRANACTVTDDTAKPERVGVSPTGSGSVALDPGSASN